MDTSRLFEGLGMISVMDTQLMAHKTIWSNGSKFCLFGAMCVSSKDYTPISYHISSTIYILINRFFFFLINMLELKLWLLGSLSLWAQTYCGDSRILLFEMKGYIGRLIWSYQLLEFFLRINHDFSRIILKIS